MISWLKKHFIPHHGNDHRPHILRDQGARNVIAIVIFLEIFSFLIPTLANLNLTGGMAAVLPAVLGQLTNEERAAQNLSVLSENSLLNNAAQMKAEDMATKGYFAHTSPEGLTPWYWIEIAGYKYQYAGENLAVNFHDSIDVTKAWMNSPSHKANIVKGNYTEIGTGIARGTYKGRNTIFVAQVYANPKPGIGLQTRAATTTGAPAVTTVASIVPEGEGDESVLGAEIALEETTESVTTTEIESEPQAESVAETAFRQEPTFWQKLLASPRNTTNIFMGLIFLLIAITLVLYVFIKAKNHHADILTNGLATLAIIGAIFAANYHFSYQDMVITQSVDYSAGVR